MNTRYEIVPREDVMCIGELCNQLMDFYKSVAYVYPNKSSEISHQILEDFITVLRNL